jgi:Ca2+-binding RTX toxin-like protein
MGGVSNDFINAGKGDDLIDGGRGRDRMKGGRGNDVFVIAKTHGRDIIVDFKDHTDYIGLAKGLEYDDLEIMQQKRGTLIRSGNRALTLLQGVNAEAITAGDIVQISMDNYKGMIVPNLTA